MISHRKINIYRGFIKENYVKKVLLFIIILLGVSGGLWAEGDMEIRKVDSSDFYFYSLKDPDLYPEIAFRNNPAVLTNLREKLTLSSTSISGLYETPVTTRLDDSIGQRTGTETNKRFLINPYIDMTFLTPGEKDGNLSGFDFTLDGTYDVKETIDKNFNAYTENRVTKDETLYVAGNLGYTGASKANDLGLGYFGYYGYYFSPHAFKMVTDTTFDPTLVSYNQTIPIMDKDVHIHSLSGGFGLAMPILAGDLFLSAQYNGSLTDRSNKFVPADKNGDGFNETIMTNHDYSFIPIIIGEEKKQATGFSQLDLSLYTRLDVRPSFRFLMTKDLMMLFSGNYRVLDRVDRWDYERIDYGTADEDKDKSINISHADAGLTSFDVFLGFLFLKEDSDVEFRIGAGYSMYNERVTLEGLSPAGQRKFHSDNRNNYVEAALGTEPPNNIIQDRGEINPSNTEQHTINFKAGLEYNLAPGVALFSSMNIGGSLQTKKYCMFNLDTVSAWSETETSGVINWNISAVAGLAFPLSEKLTCTLECGAMNTYGSYDYNSESQVKDLQLDRASADGSVDAEGYSGINFSINLGFTVKN